MKIVFDESSDDYPTTPYLARGDFSGLLMIVGDDDVMYLEGDQTVEAGTVHKRYDTNCTPINAKVTLSNEC